MPESNRDEPELLIEVQSAYHGGTDVPSQQTVPGAPGYFPQGSTQVRNATEVASAQIGASAAELQSSIRRIVDAVAGALKDAGPDEYSAEFGISFKTTAGVPMLVSGEASANLKIILSWKR